MYTVYMHISPSDKVYVGLTSQRAESRWRGGKGYKKNQPFWRAIQKYGWDNIEHKIIADGLTYEEAANIEKEYIKKYNATNKKYGYNICFGGEDGWVGVHHTEEAKRKMSESKKGKTYRKGYHLSEETKRKISEAHKGKYKGKPVKPKEKAPYWRKRNGKMYLSYPRQYDENGKIIFTEEHKQKISEAKKGYCPTEQARINMSKAQVKTKKPVKCLDTGEVFESETAAMKKLGISIDLIGRCCKGKQKTAKGLRFRYV